MELNSLAEDVIQIAYTAGAAIMEVYIEYDDIGLEHKSDNSPLTIADKKANDIIIERLNNLSVNYPVISEENKAIPFSIRNKFDRFWMVDPLDGTKEFIKRNGEFTVNIALIENGYPILGVVYAPALDEMYWAAKGLGAYKVRNNINHKIIASEFDASDSELRIVCSRSHMNDPTKSFINQFKNPELVPTGSSLKIVFLAEGKAEIYPRLGPTMEWDIAAAHIILEESNGRLQNAKDLSSISYNKQDLLNPYFVAYGNGDISSLVSV